VTPIVETLEEPTIPHTPIAVFPTIAAHHFEQPIRSKLRIAVTDLCGTGKNLRHTTIDDLPEEILLEVFDFYRLEAVERSRGGRPWKWHRLAHVCQRWRYVVSISPRRLRLQIPCKSGAPIEPILDTWPTLPILVRYKAIGNPSPCPVISSLRSAIRTASAISISALRVPCLIDDRCDAEAVPVTGTPS
jgi:hypothetical protein